MQYSLTVEVDSNDDGYLINPIVFEGIVINELGMYTKKVSNDVEFKIWAVPKAVPIKKRENSVRAWFIKTDLVDYDDSYFIGFEPKTMCDIDCNEQTGESVNVKRSLRQARIFTNKETAEEAVKLLNVLESSYNWKIVEIA